MRTARLELTLKEVGAAMRGCLARAGESKAMDRVYWKLAAAFAALQPRRTRPPCGCRSAGHELCGG